jgi:serine/threonine protein kinase
MVTNLPCPFTLDVCRKGSEGFLDTAMSLLAQACLAVMMLHDSGIMWLDGKAGNFIVTLDGQGVKVSDLGCARLMRRGDRRAHLWAVCGTPGHIAPEMAITPDKVGRAAGGSAGTAPTD